MDAQQISSETARLKINDLLKNGKLAMVSLFLVESEMLSRESIKKNGPWAENGIEFLENASDSEMALLLKAKILSQ